MFTESTTTVKSLPTSTPKLIVFRFVTIENIYKESHKFSWLSFESASSYIVHLSNSEGVIFHDKVEATGKNRDGYNRETYIYEGSLLQPGEDYLFTVEIGDQDSFSDHCRENNEETIAGYVAKGISEIRQLESFSNLSANLLAQLDALLIARNEILDIICGVTRQGSNSEFIGFLNYFLSQDSAFQLLASPSNGDKFIDALSEIATQLAAANITLSNYLHLSEIQMTFAEKIAEKGVDLAIFSHKIQGNFQFIPLSIRKSSSTCHPGCWNLSESSRCSIKYREYCGGCECNNPD